MDNGTGQAAQGAAQGTNQPAPQAGIGTGGQTDRTEFAPLPFGNATAQYARGQAGGQQGTLAQAQAQAPAGQAAQGAPGVPQGTEAQTGNAAQAAGQAGIAQAQGTRQAAPAQGTAAQASPDVPQGTDAQTGQPAGPDPEDTPITDWAAAKIEIAGADAGALASFGKTAEAIGLTPRQAKALAEWQLDDLAARREAIVNDSLAQLHKEWGANAGSNQQACNNLIARIDKAIGSNGFSEAIAKSGADCFAGFARGLLAIARITAEDTSGTGAGFAARPRKETAADGIRDAFFKATGRTEIFGGKF